MTEMPLQVDMPLGNEQNAFSTIRPQIVVPYGLRSSNRPEPDLSLALKISVPPTGASSEMRAMIRGRIRLVLTTTSGVLQPRLELQPLPFEQIQLGNRIGGSSLPNFIIYDNVDLPTVELAIKTMLEEDLPAEKVDNLRNAFRLGNYWLTVNAGTVLGKPAVDNTLNNGCRRLDLMIKDRNGFFLNPAYYIFHLPLINPELSNHSLGAIFSTSQQHKRIFPTKGTRTLYVSKSNSGGPIEPYDTAATAATEIVDALHIARKGDLVVVLDDDAYEGGFNLPDGVTLTSTATLHMTTRASNLLVSFPTITMPSGHQTENLVTLRNLTCGHISGFDTTSNCRAFSIIDSQNIEIAQNIIHDNRATQGGGIAIENSSRINIDGNKIFNNYATGSDGKGGGIYLFTSRNVVVCDNSIAGNIAEVFGGGLAVFTSQDILVRRNDIALISLMQYDLCNFVRLVYHPYETLLLGLAAEGG